MICDRIEEALKAEIPSVRVTIHVEPDDEAKLPKGTRPCRSLEEKIRASSSGEDLPTSPDRLRHYRHVAVTRVWLHPGVDYLNKVSKSGRAC